MNEREKLIQIIAANIAETIINMVEAKGKVLAANNGDTKQSAHEQVGRRGDRFLRPR